MELWTEDEARLGLKPIVRRVWAAWGIRPTAHQKPRYQWLYLLGFVRPETGEVFWLVMPSMDAEVWSVALREFAAHVGAGPDKRIVLVLDGAGFHTAREVVVPDGIHLVWLPPYSPELQPAERLWPLVRESLANRVFDDIDDLEDTVCARCRELDEQHDVVRRLCRFHWWPAVAAA
ncbi:MAG: IS630 family transposase [Alphaproteobacteria bacterium]|nr:IS630 family transposase [Alphaproteobacteria bacterium]